jgi:hypothetical protein
LIESDNDFGSRRSGLFLAERGFRLRHDSENGSHGCGLFNDERRELRATAIDVCDEN